MKYYFPIHLDGDNRGCEAIAKGTAQILGVSKEKMIGYCTNIPLDLKLGLGDYYTLVPTRRASLSFRIKNKIHSFFIKDEVENRNLNYSYQYNHFLDQITDNDIMLSTGGDMFCYANCQVNYTVDYLAARNKKTVLWGCSIGKKNLTPEKIVSLHNFSAVVARESLTKQLFEEMGLKKVFMYPDPAFSLEEEACEIPEFMNTGDVVGINFSNFVGHDVSVDSVLGMNLRSLVSYIIQHTSMNILLIPHVLWHMQDDRIVCSEIFDEFKNTERVALLNSEKYNYCQLRYIISKCRLFIGARTHSMISAYSMCVPAMALGYSIKSIGIAKDLGLPEYSVVDITRVSRPDEMAEVFALFLENEDKIKNHLTAIMPDYKAKSMDAKNVFIAL